MRSDVDATGIRTAFANCNLQIEEDAISTCLSICSEFSLSADEFTAQWDAYSMNHQLVDPAQDENLGAFRSHLAHLRQQKNKENHATSASSNVGTKRKSSGTPVIKKEFKFDHTSQLDALYQMKSPDASFHHRASFTSPPGKKTSKAHALFSPTSLPSPPGCNYENRTDAGQSVFEFNAHLKVEIETKFNNMKMDVKKENEQIVAIQIPFPDRHHAVSDAYMYTPLFERAMALDQQLEEYEKLVKQRFELTELHVVGDPSPAQVTVVGRIVCEANEGKLNASVVQLEGSRKTCGGQRVLLDLSGVIPFQIFPGKIVAIEGVYEDVRSPMAVKRFLEPIPAPMPATLPAKLNEVNAKPIRVMAACGPFTTASNVLYLPLIDLLQTVKTQNPDVLILVGPFIDSAHGSFNEGYVAYDGMMVSFEDIFLFKVMAVLDSVLGSNPHLQVVLVPSLRDAHHDYVYPQPPFNKTKACEALEDSTYGKRIHMMPNPCTFSINHVVFGVSAVDVVMQMSSNELYRSPVRDQNRLLRLCEQIVDQRSFYPIFPPPSGSDAPLDLKYMKHFQFEKTPDVLILPSILNRFAGRVKDSICINPGQLCRGQAGGTYAMITIMPLADEKVSAEAMLDEPIVHSVPDRTYIEIRRI